MVLWMVPEMVHEHLSHRVEIGLPRQAVVVLAGRKEAHVVVAGHQHVAAPFIRGAEVHGLRSCQCEEPLVFCYGRRGQSQRQRQSAGQSHHPSFHAGFRPA